MLDPKKQFLEDFGGFFHKKQFSVFSFFLHFFKIILCVNNKKVRVVKISPFFPL